MDDNVSGDNVPLLMLTVPQFARACQMGTMKCWGLVRAGVIPCVRFGRSVRIPVRELETWIAGHAGGAMDPPARPTQRSARRRPVAGRAGRS